MIALRNSMRRYEKISFELISLADVPSHSPVAKPASDPKGSQWDEVLRVLEQERGERAVKIVEPNKRKRDKLKSTLQTMAKNRELFVKVRADDTAVYAWITKETGRYTPPQG
jgi:hypothetical protein